MGFEPVVIKYGHYSENEFKAALKDSLFGVWIGVHESQGIALQEALASDLPLVVLDATRFSDNYSQDANLLSGHFTDFATTSAPYFDSTCGIIIEDEAEMDAALLKMLQNHRYYKPRNYVLKELTLEASARKLVYLFERDISRFSQHTVVSPLRYYFAERAASIALNTENILNRYFSR
jgi:hypothetical protein